MSLQKFYRQVFIDEERTILVHCFHRSADIYVFLSCVRKLSIYAHNESPITTNQHRQNFSQGRLVDSRDFIQKLEYSVSFTHHRRIVLCLKTRLIQCMFLKVGLWVRGLCENTLCVCVACPKCCVKMQCQLAPIHWATYPVVGASCSFQVSH